jgi:hypothetical protein
LVTITKNGAFVNTNTSTGNIGDPVQYLIQAERDWYSHEIKVSDTLPIDFIATNIVMDPASTA